MQQGASAAPFRQNITLDSGDGNDSIDVAGAYNLLQAPPIGVATLKVDAGAGDDFAHVLWPTATSVNLTATADGGPGFDRRILSPNVQGTNWEG